MFRQASDRSALCKVRRPSGAEIGHKLSLANDRYPAVGRSARGIADAGNHRKKMKFKCIEFSWRAAFIGVYLTPERDRLWVTIIPFFPLYFKRR